MDPAGMIVEVTVETRDGVPRIGTPVTQMQSWPGGYVYRYGILPDGRFLLLEDTGEVEKSPVCARVREGDPKRRYGNTDLFVQGLDARICESPWAAGRKNLSA